MQWICESLTRLRWRWPAGFLYVAAVIAILAAAHPAIWLLGPAALVGLAMLVKQGRGLIFGMLAVALLLGWRTEQIDSQRSITLPARASAAMALPVEMMGVIDIQSLRTGEHEQILRVETVNHQANRGRVMVRGALPELRPGDRVRVEGTLRPLPGARNPGQYDAARRYANFGIGDEVTVYRLTDCRIEARDQLSWPWRLALAARESIERHLQVGFGPEATTPKLLRALVLGDRTALDAEWRERFRLTGTAHLFAVSGLHVGLVAGAIYLLTWPLARYRWWRVGLTVGVALFYSMITGMAPSSVRATVMTAVVLLALCFERRPFSFNTLFVAALVLLLIHPLYLFDAGYQLSFAVVAALLLFSPAIYQGLARRVSHDPFIPEMVLTPWQRRWEKGLLVVSGLFAANLAAWIGAVPLSITYFQLISPIGLPTNLLLAPLASLLLGLGLLSGVLGGWLPWIGWGLNKVSVAFSSLVLLMVQTASEIPGGYRHLSWRELAPRPAFAMVIADVGKGGLQLVRTPDEAWLIDAGPQRSVRSVLLPLLRWDGVRELDGLVLSHGDAGHYGGALEVVKQFHPEQLIENAADDRSPTRRAYQRFVSDKGWMRERCAAGDGWMVEAGLEVEVLHPPYGWTNRHSDNKGLALLMEIGGRKVLLLSDLGFAGLHELRKRYPDLRVDLVVHGACRPDPVLDPGLLLWTEPGLVVINRGDAFGDRRERAAWLAKLRRSEAVIWDQEQHGAVLIQTRHGQLEAEGYLSKAQWRPRRVP